MIKVTEAVSDDSGGTKETDFTYDGLTQTTENAEGQTTKRVFDGLGRVVRSYDTSHAAPAEPNNATVPTAR